MTPRVTIFFIFLTTLILTSCVDRKPKDIFCAVLDCDKLKSAKIIHAEDQDFSECCIWLHFTIDSIELVNEVRNCTESDFCICDTTEHEAKWWNPKKMGTNIKCFSRNIDRDLETFFVNSRMTEVYYQNAHAAH